MEFSQLRYFMEVARLGHVTESARALNVVQPAVTQAIRRLEAELGAELFIHGGKSMTLTASGRLLYEELVPVMQTLDELPEKIRMSGRQEGATVRLNIRAAWTLVANATMEYQRIDPLLNIELTETERLDMADISITTRQPAHALPKKVRENVRVFREQIFLAVPNTPRWQGKKRVNLKDVQGSRFITLSGVKHFREICDRICASAGMRPHFVFESDSPISVINMITSGMGVGFWPAFSWIQTDPRRVRLLEIERPAASRDLIITCGKTAQENVHIRLFYDFLCGYFEVYARRAASR